MDSQKTKKVITDQDVQIQAKNHYLMKQDLMNGIDQALRENDRERFKVLSEKYKKVSARDSEFSL